MLAANETATLISHIPGDTGDSYACTVLRRVSWHGRRGVGALGSPELEYTARIFDDTQTRPKPGDYLVKGEVTGLSSPSQLSGSEHFRITAVTDDRRGLLRHWRLTGS